MPTKRLISLLQPNPEMKNHVNAKIRGFSLIETAIVLAVVGLVIGGIWVAAASVRETMTARQLAEGLLLIKSRVQQNIPRTMAAGFTPSSANYIQAELYYTIGSQMGLIPGDWVESTGRARLPTGQNLTITAAEYGGEPVGIISASAGAAGEPNLRPSICIKAFSNIVKRDPEITARINGSYSYTFSAATRTLEYITTMCTANGPTTINGFSLTFPLTRN